ncbi:MAG: hypothetical protein R3C16_09455 [Hyphomonadaceae bacterium]
MAAPGAGASEVDGRDPQSTKMVYDLAFDGVDTRRFLTDAVNFTNIEGRGEVSVNVRTEAARKAT